MKNIGKQENLRFDGVKFYSVHFDILGNPKENTEINLDIIPKVTYNTNTQFNIVYDVKLYVFKLKWTFPKRVFS
jgi:hypothetical protein